MYFERSLDIYKLWRDSLYEDKEPRLRGLFQLVSKLRAKRYHFARYQEFENLPDGHAGLQTINLILAEVDQVLNMAVELQGIVCPKCFVLHNEFKTEKYKAASRESLETHIPSCKGLCRRCFHPKHECAEACKLGKALRCKCPYCPRCFASEADFFAHYRAAHVAFFLHCSFARPDKGEYWDQLSAQEKFRDAYAY